MYIPSSKLVLSSLTLSVHEVLLQYHLHHDTDTEVYYLRLRVKIGKLCYNFPHKQMEVQFLHQRRDTHTHTHTHNNILVHTHIHMLTHTPVQ